FVLTFVGKNALLLLAIYYVHRLKQDACLFSDVKNLGKFIGYCMITHPILRRFLSYTWVKTPLP
ncbi:MAG: hypothetical protein ACI9FJ_002922, partial [Alteromonadaceae bacterium]